MMRELKYEDGITIQHSAAIGWIDDTGDPDSLPAKNIVTLPPRSIAELEQLLSIAAARCAAADASGLELEFGPNSRLKFTGRMIGAGRECGWLEVRLRVERTKYGDPMAACHLRRYLVSSGAERHPMASRILAFLARIEKIAVLGARDEHPEWRKTLDDQIRATHLPWWLEDAGKAHGAALPKTRTTDCTNLPATAGLVEG